jgi:hypothetical protein
MAQLTRCRVARLQPSVSNSFVRRVLVHKCSNHDWSVADYGPSADVMNRNGLRPVVDHVPEAVNEKQYAAIVCITRA